MVILVAKSQLPPDKADAFLEKIKENSAKVQAIAGLKKIHFFLDRKTGRAGTVSYWESEESLKAGGPALQELRDQTVGGLGGKIESVEPYEVIHTLGAEAAAAR
jgi:heme-degrading monooxygenase HmoA